MNMNRLLSLVLAVLLTIMPALSCAEGGQTLPPFTLAQYQAFLADYADFFPTEWVTDESGAVFCDGTQLVTDASLAPLMVRFDVNEDGYVTQIIAEGSIDSYDENYRLLAEDAMNRMNLCMLLSSFAFMVENGRYTDVLVRRYVPPMLALLEKGGETIIDGCPFVVSISMDAKGIFHYVCSLTTLLPGPEASPEPDMGRTTDE